MAKEVFSDWTEVIKTTTKPDKESGAVNPSIQMSSTFEQRDFDRFGKWDYARSGNPTRDVLEESIAKLEHGNRGFAFATGMAAISTALLTLNQGDHVILTKNVYGGTFRLVTEVLVKYGIDYTFVDLGNEEELRAAFQDNTKVVYIETPSNPTLQVTDIRLVVEIAHAHQALVFADNTFMTPVLQKPLDLGVDLVVHSATKFLAGHSDILAGLVVTKDEELGKQVYFLQNAMGATLGVSDSWLLLRGIKTLAVRMEKESANALELAEWLEQQPLVTKVNYPGLKNDDNYQVQAKQAKSGGAVLSFDIGSEDNVRQLIKEVKIPIFSVSLGAVESIISYPPKMSHAEMNPVERHERGITDGLIRYSVGLEDIEDLKADLQQAFDKIK
ncbi:cystathionine beta-lyase [Fructobacillus pseudoficulneus]|uniref:cysteine-S-conjugate beta-lyase n=1 Tax=Fructobacillus pseudoficulneus TaxID=220714 RepID=A0A3F3H8N1_9LACO|nr:aminotransferase class V-fold PLP-dependent enzyme [Fructobacillus pseudoficulneus]GAP02939.1 cystathionine beta-lyase [Fructobacillus pseudoficulneus]SEH44959.1 cystathionine beta-lyase [Fructobacillus pseudoficulneus]